MHGKTRVHVNLIRFKDKIKYLYIPFLVSKDFPNRHSLKSSQNSNDELLNGSQYCHNT